MNPRIAFAGLIIALLPIAVMAAPMKPHKTAKTSATIFQCQTCHMKFGAAVAKKDHYKDPMDGGKLVPIKAAAKSTIITPGKTTPPKGAISM